MSSGVAERLAAIERRIAAACSRARRDPAAITLVGAAKRQSDQRLEDAARAGLRNFGENIVQEGETHRGLLADFELSWHLIGPLQSNKVRKAAELFDTVHSIDRLKIARKLDTEAARLGKTMLGFLEVNLGAESTKHGFLREELSSVAAAIAPMEHLKVVGLMAIPPIAESEEESRRHFRELRELCQCLLPSGGLLSMGMSSDFEIAIEEGATHVRIGSALFGPRAPRPSEPS